LFLDIFSANMNRVLRKLHVKKDNQTRGENKMGPKYYWIKKPIEPF